MSTIRLITRADDAGMHPVVNRAIRATVADGIVRNVSLMAPSPAIDDAAEVLVDLDGRADFGMHVTLTCEWPNLRWKPLTGADAASFVRPDGTMHFTVDEIGGAPDLDAVMKEVEAQYDHLVSLGFPVSYLDEHMDIGRIAGLRDRLERFAAERGLASHSRLLGRGAFVRLPGWSGPAEHPGTELADHLASLASGTYLIVGHPATKDEALQRIHHPRQAPGEEAVSRNRQRRMFMDIEIVDYCENVEIELLRYRDVE